MWSYPNTKILNKMRRVRHIKKPLSPVTPPGNTLKFTDFLNQRFWQDNSFDRTSLNRLKTNSSTPRSFDRLRARK